MTPKDRERAYEKRRYEEWQARLAQKRADNRRVRRRLALGAGSVLVVLIIVGVFFLVGHNGDDSGDTSAAAPTTTPAATASSSATAGAAATAKSTCPAVDVKAPSSPKQYSSVPSKSVAGGKTWTMTLNTTCGPITISMDGAKAPQAVSSMITLAKAGFFDGTPCHRLVTEGIYVLQCGDPTGTGTGGPGYNYGPIENAPADNVYPAGTVAMARTGDNASSMGSQFFLVYQDSSIPADSAGGYTVLGNITKGLDVVTKVAKGGAEPADANGNTAPVSAVSIRTATVTG